MQTAIAVFGDDVSLATRLADACPELTFARNGAGCAVAIVDGGTEPEPAVAIRVILTRPGDHRRRRDGEIHVDRDAFLADPEPTLGLALDFAAALSHSFELETEVGYLTEIQNLMRMHDAESVSERVTRTVLNILTMRCGALLLHDPRLERYVISFSNDGEFKQTDDFLSGLPSDALQRALAEGGLYVIDGTHGLLLVPLKSGEDLIGVLRIPIPAGAQLSEPRLADLRRYLRLLLQVLGSVYMQTRSHDLAMRDDLTKSFNRRFFESYLDEEIERSRRYGGFFSIIFLDLDDLKSVNNRHGHLVGSRTLQEVAKRILGAVRGIDKVVRFGGDEFCVILPQTDFEQAAAVANRIRKSLTAGKFFIEPDIEVSISASFGIASYPTHAITKEDLIRRADLAMYRVKSTTKNAVGIATVEDAPSPLSTRIVETQ